MPLLFPLLFLLLSTNAAASPLPPAVPAKRMVMAWASANPAAVAQIRNASWRGIFDGVQASCGATFDATTGLVVVNATQMAACDPLREAVHAQGGKFHAWINAVPAAAIANPAPVVTSALSAAMTYNLDGFSIDDEFDCAPRSTLSNFTAWVGFVDALAEGLHGAKGGRLELSAAVQAMFGIQDVTYAPACKPPENPSCSQACNKAPWAYPAEPRVVDLMAHSKIDRWLEMDTYYFGTGRFLNALDWYTDNVPTEKLGVAMMNRDDISEDGCVGVGGV